ncbi:MAG: rhodanese-like domain-containing protein [Thermoanaerobaculia bacterium]|nr:rhodanese-like domain-containing protein [Thermoanaerobaculia bacterium]
MQQTITIFMLSLTFIACAGDPPEATRAVSEAVPQQEAAVHDHDHSSSEPIDNVPRISVEDLRAGLEEGWAVVLDVRSAQQHAAGHIEGSISIPITELEARADELPKDRMIVTYCT